MTAAAILFLLEVAVILWAAGYLKREKARKEAHEARHQLTRYRDNDQALWIYEARREVGGHGVRRRG